MTELEIKNEMQKVCDVVERHHTALDETGARFNIFELLGLQNKEVKLHSRFIGNLLDPKGKHTFKGKFLEIFISKLNKELPIVEYIAVNDNYCKIKIEERVGVIEGDTGGQIDLQIVSGKTHIIIENKIFAGDQDKQLVRYRNHNKDAILLYLNLEGSLPNDASITDTHDKKLEIDKDFFVISYKKMILDWLTDCMQMAVHKPKISETISQYINTIKFLTNQSTNHKMTEELKHILKSNKAFYTNITDLVSARDSLIADAKNLLITDLAQFVEMNCMYNPQIENLKISIEFDYDDNSLYYGFELKGNNVELKKGTVKENYENQNIFKINENILKDTKKSPLTGCWLYWEYDKENRNLDTFTKAEYFDFLDFKNRQNLYEDILDQAKNSAKKNIIFTSDSI